MRTPKPAALVACAMLVACCGPTAASAHAPTRLTVRGASERSSRFAKHTCARDKHCVGSGVLNCRRQAPRVVLCRVYDERDTRIQGRYRCDRLIRVSLVPRRGIPVTGLGRWRC